MEGQGINLNLTEEEILLLEVFDKDVLDQLIECSPDDPMQLGQEWYQTNPAGGSEEEQFFSIRMENATPLVDERVSPTSGSPSESQSTQDSSEEQHNRCPVCEDGDVGRHSYYGGRSCHSCRGFFRRSVQSGHHHLFQCKTGTSTCRVLSRSRKSCTKCRFARCLKLAGLKPELVLSKEERKERLVKRSLGKKKAFRLRESSGETREVPIFVYVKFKIS